MHNNLERPIQSLSLKRVRKRPNRREGERGGRREKKKRERGRRRGGRGGKKRGQCFLRVHINHLEGLLNHTYVPYSRVSGLVGLEQDPRLCISKSPSNANADKESINSITLGKPLLKVIAPAFSYFSCSNLQGLSQFLKMKKNVLSVCVYSKAS